MLSDSQPSAHRVQPPPRSKARWQPYSYQTLGSATSDMNTPKPSVPPTPLPSVTPLSLTNNQPQFPKDLIQRDVGKQKYALGLIDQAVKTLSEIWRPEDIPSVFIGPPKPSCPLTNPILHSSPQSLVSTGAEMDSALLPLKNFVHEVLKRSRTSGSVMQTALCYLEAIRPQVPEILRDENLGIRSYFMPESAILPATEAELQMDQKLSNSEASDAASTSDEWPKTVRVTDEEVDVASDPCETSSITPQPTSLLPSPLLCPRRTFLASLILACKFSQDKCYSNRAWAKLSGLPPREIGRCERALGQALDWRLWVGKKASTSRDVANSVITSVPAGPSRPILRTQSESSIHITPSLREPFLRPSDPKRPDPPCPNLGAPVMGAAVGAWTGPGLHRCSTAPTESFTGSRLPPNHSDSLVSNLEATQKDTCWIQVPYASSDSSSSVSSSSSPETPPLSYSPSTSGDRTVQISSYEDGMFPSISQSRLDLDDSRFTSSAYSASPSSFLADTKLCGSTAVSTPHPESKLTAMQLQMSLAESISESLWGSRLGIVTGSHLWHADGGHISLGSSPVH